MQLLNAESGKVIAKLGKDIIYGHLKKDYPDSFREKRLHIHKKQCKLTRELEQRRDKKWLKFKSQKLRTAIINNGVKNNDNKVFSNYTVDNITAVEVVENQSKRKRPAEDKVRRKKTYAEILKTDRDKDDMLEKNRNEEAVDIVANKGCLGVHFQVNESHITNNCVQRKRLKTAKPKIVNPCELGDTDNVSLTSEMVCDYKRGKFKTVISPPVISDKFC